MEIVMLAAEENRDAAIKYVYDHAIPSKIPYDTFHAMVLDRPRDGLPEFYILKSEGAYIGYLLLLADTMETIPKPFTFLACHNGDKLSRANHCELLQFIMRRAEQKKYPKLEWLARNELLSLT